MKIAIISGSNRKDSQSDRVAGYIHTTLTGRNISSEVISLAGNPLPFEEYARALTAVRESGAINHREFPYGV